MGRKRKDFSDKFKIEVAKEALKKRAKETEVAAKYNIAPSTLSEWMELFLDGKLETEEYQDRLAWTLHMGIMEYLNQEQ